MPRDSADPKYLSLPTGVPRDLASSTVTYIGFGVVNVKQDSRLDRRLG
jgi:hypothetical protein